MHFQPLFRYLTIFLALAAASAAFANEAAKKPVAPAAPAAQAKNEKAGDADKKGDKQGDPLLHTESIISSVSAQDRTRPFPVGEKVAYFTNIKDGDKVRSPFRVAFAVSGMGVSPVSAGEVKNTGHHHILINMSMPADIKKPIPFDKADEYKNQRYKHFGKGETETVLDLPPGKHTLRLLFADHNHVPYYVKSKEITIEVEDTKKFTQAQK